MNWSDLSSTARDGICSMVEFEANRFLTAALTYYRTEAGVVLTPGDSKAEEVAWNGGILSLAATMIPTHPNHAAWTKQSISYALAARARPNDLSIWGTSIVNGQTLNTWLNGTNLYNDGSVVNHARVHPEYHIASTLAAQGIAFQSLAQKPSPLGLIRGFTVVYDSLVDLPWTAGSLPAQYASDSKLTGTTIASPGGRTYQNTTSSPTDPSDIYYPIGNNWGTGQRGTYTVLDAIGDAGTIPSGARFDANASLGGNYWGPGHIFVQQQSRLRGIRLVAI